MGNESRLCTVVDIFMVLYDARVEYTHTGTHEVLFSAIS